MAVGKIERSGQKKPRVFMIGLGGTIGAKEINNVWESGVLSQNELLVLDENMEKNFDIETSNIFRLHSADTQPEHWQALSNIIFKKLKGGFDGIVVTHGTDTMHYTASALSFLIQSLSIPIVFTGSQIIPEKIGSDAPKNIYDSLFVASKADLAEVAIVFNGKILRANRSRKVKAADFDAYRSSGVNPLGFVQHEIVLNGHQIKRAKRKPKLFSKIETDVTMLQVHPGFNPRLLENAVNEGSKGIVLSGYGVGNYPVKKNSLTPTINQLADEGIPVVLTSQCRMSTDWKNVFFPEIGTRYDDSKVILGYDMTSPAALVKLMWVLGQTSNSSKIKKMMQTNYAGEITPRVFRKTISRKRKA